MRIVMRPAAACTLILLALAGCSAKGQEPGASSTQLPVASALATITLQNALAPFSRPTASLGLFMSIYLSELERTDAKAALEGISSQLKLHSEESPLERDETFALLEEFGAVLQVNIPDLLNRSATRAETLNQYVSGLRNISIRATSKAAELKARLDAVRMQEREATSRLRAVERTISEALRSRDYFTVGAEQKNLTEAQTKAAAIQAEQEQLRDILRTFEDLIALAEKRLKAIEENREVLVAGLKVVEVPGIEDLDLIRQERGGGRRRGFGL